jgi:hypothetical protein
MQSAQWFEKRKRTGKTSGKYIPGKLTGALAQNAATVETWRGFMSDQMKL